MRKKNLTKTSAQKLLLQYYYRKCGGQWNQHHLDSLANSIGLTRQKVYKWLWDKRNISKKAERADGSGQTKVQEDFSKYQYIFEEQQELQQLVFDKKRLEIPKSLHSPRLFNLSPRASNWARRFLRKDGWEVAQSPQRQFDSLDPENQALQYKSNRSEPSNFPYLKLEHEQEEKGIKRTLIQSPHTPQTNMKRSAFETEEKNKLELTRSRPSLRLVIEDSYQNSVINSPNKPQKSGASTTKSLLSTSKNLLNKSKSMVNISPFAIVQEDHEIMPFKRFQTPQYINEAKYQEKEPSQENYSQKPTNIKSCGEEKFFRAVKKKVASKKPAQPEEIFEPES